jgi:hypothetical protein
MRDLGIPTPAAPYVASALSNKGAPDRSTPTPSLYCVNLSVLHLVAQAGCNTERKAVILALTLGMPSLTSNE